jgi:hypothetical protein
VRQSNSVVLPAPFGPMSPQISPAANDTLTSDRALTPPKAMVTACASRMGDATLPLLAGPPWLTTDSLAPFVMMSILADRRLQLRAEIGTDQLLVVEALPLPGPHDVAQFDEGGPIGHREHVADLLLHQQNGGAQVT